jgi:hypothetical protein
VPNLAAIAAVPLSAHLLCRCLALLTTTTLSLLVIKSNTLLTVKVSSTYIYCLL